MTPKLMSPDCPGRRLLGFTDAEEVKRRYMIQYLPQICKFETTGSKFVFDILPPSVAGQLPGDAAVKPRENVNLKRVSCKMVSHNTLDINFE